MKIMDFIKQKEKKIDQTMFQFINNHPYVAWITLFIGMPVFMLAAVIALTTAIMFPISVLFGWV